MKKSQRLQTIVDIKAREEKSLLENLGQLQTKKQQKQAQLEHLESYRQDYLQQNEPLIQRGVSVMRMMEFRAFIDKLDKAIETEKVSIKDLDDDLERLRSSWEKAHLYTLNMQKIQDKALLSEHKQAEKKEQLEMDEHASRMSTRHGIDGA